MVHFTVFNLESGNGSSFLDTAPTQVSTAPTGLDADRGEMEDGKQKGPFKEISSLSVLLVKIPLEIKDLPHQQPSKKNSQDLSLNCRWMKLNRK